MASRRGRRRFTTREGEILWAAIETADEAEQHEVLRELATEFAARGITPGSTRGKVRQGIGALHEAADILGRAPTISEYRRLRIELPELALPSDANIRR